MSNADSPVTGMTATACGSAPIAQVAGAAANGEAPPQGVPSLAPAGGSLTGRSVAVRSPAVTNGTPALATQSPTPATERLAREPPAGAPTSSPVALMSRRFRGFLPVVIDVETGGFHSTTDALLEIAAVLIDMQPDGTLKRGATHSFHVRPFEGARLDPAALAITGIDPFHPLRPALPEKDALGRVFREIRHAVHAYNCRRAILVGHNAAFDLGFLNAAVTRADVKRNPFHPFSCFDTATLAGAALGQTVLAKALAVAGLQWDPSSAHSASYDAEKTADVFCLICNRLNDSFRDAQDRACSMGWMNAAPPAEAAADEPPLDG